MNQKSPEPSHLTDVRESQMERSSRAPRQSLVDVDESDRTHQSDGIIPQTGWFYHRPHQAGQPLIESNILTHLWSIPSLALFTCALLQPQSTVIDWYKLYEILCLRRRAALLYDSNRIQNAFEPNRIIEQTQAWVPNLQYYDNLPAGLSLEQSRRHCTAFQEHALQDLLQTYPEIFQNPQQDQANSWRSTEICGNVNAET